MLFFYENLFPSRSVRNPTMHIHIQWAHYITAEGVNARPRVHVPLTDDFSVVVQRTNCIFFLNQNRILRVEATESRQPKIDRRKSRT